jgi:hypothetical protein
VNPIYNYIRYKAQGKNNGNSILHKHLSTEIGNNRKENYFNDVKFSKEVTSVYIITTRDTSISKD